MLVKIAVDFSYYHGLIYCINGIFDIAIHLALQTSHHLKGDTPPSRLDKKINKVFVRKTIAIDNGYCYNTAIETNNTNLIF